MSEPTFEYRDYFHKVIVSMETLHGAHLAHNLMLIAHGRYEERRQSYVTYLKVVDRMLTASRWRSALTGKPILCDDQGYYTWPLR